MASMVIAVVSAQTYTYLYLTGSITVITQKLVWIKDGLPITGASVSINLIVEQNVPVNITNRLYLKNMDSAAHNLTITVTDTVGDNYEYCKIYIYKNVSNSWVHVATLDAEMNSQYSTYTANDPIAAYPTGCFKFDFGINATSSTGDNEFKLTVVYE
ncbi:MAG: hypothetical protein QW791_04815 [Candidatus Bathyarchaeia archaeon]